MTRGEYDASPRTTRPIVVTSSSSDPSRVTQPAMPASAQSEDHGLELGDSEDDEPGGGRGLDQRADGRELVVRGEVDEGDVRVCRSIASSAPGP